MRRLLVVGLALGVAALGMWRLEEASGQGATLSLSGVPASVTAGGPAFNVEIRVADVANLAGYDWQLEFDSAIVQFVGVTNGPFLGSTGRSVPQGCPFASSEGLEPGNIRYGCPTFGLTPPGPNGSGLLSTVTFQPTSNGAPAIEFVCAALNDPDGEPIAVGNVSPCVSPITPTPTTQPGSPTPVPSPTPTPIRPQNDSFSNAIVVPSLLFSHDTSTVDATVELGEPQSCAQIAATVWYRFTATSDGVLEATTAGSDFDTALAVYTGSSLTTLKSWGCDDDSGPGLTSSLSLPAEAGVTYKFQAGGYRGEMGNLSLAIAPVPTPTPTSTPTPWPIPPHRFFGDVTLDGAPAPAGTSVMATIDGNVCGQTTVQPDSTYVVDVVSWGLTPGCGTEGATVYFSVDEWPTGTATWSSGQFTELDLSAICGDTDGDGCTDCREAAMGFDYTTWWDFYDVPVPASVDPTPNGDRDQVVDIRDTLAVLFYAFTEPTGVCGDNANSDGVDYDCDKNGDTVADGRDYDRSPGTEPNPPYDAGPPDDVVDMRDVLAALAQAFVVDCSGPP